MEIKRSFRKHVATVMAGISVAAGVYGYVAGVIPPEGGIFAGVIIGMAAKYLWEENTE